MPKYEVNVYRQAQDVLRAIIPIEAPNAAEAEIKVKEQIESGELDPEFDFHNCGEVCCKHECCQDYYEAVAV